MKHKLENKGEPPVFSIAKYGSILAVVAVVIVSYFVLFHTGVGSINSVHAQVNPGRIGEAVVEQVTEAATETEGEISGAMEEIEEPGATTEEMPTEGMEEMGDEIPVDTDLETYGDMYADLFAEQQALFTTSRDGLGGKTLTELTDTEMRTYLARLTETGGNPLMVDLAMPIMTRFQTMVSPPAQVDEENPVWESGSKRYSPFDPVVGGGPTPPPKVGPLPPFPPVGEAEIAEPGDEITAQMIANAMKLVGVMGEEGGYFAIVNVQGDERIFRVGDVLPVPETSFTIEVTEITLDAVRIVKTSKPSDEGFIQFVERSTPGIEFSISS